MSKFSRSNSQRSIVSVALLALLAPAAAAQDPKLPMLEQVRAGLPYGQGDPESGRARRGSWAPIYVKLKTGSQAIAQDSLRIVVEANDSEDIAYQYTTPLPFVDAEKDYFAVTYARPGSNEVNISLQSADGKHVPFQIRTSDGRVVTSTRLTREFSRDELSPANTLYLAVGSRLPGLGRSLAGLAADAPDDALRDDRNLRKLAFLDNVDALPDRWYGYDAVDIVVLTTASDTFVKALNEPAAAARRRALGEWVRRGGKLIVSVGRNRQLVADLLDQMPLSEFDKQPLINCKIDGAVATKGEKGRHGVPLRVLTRWATASRDAPELLEVAELTRIRPTLPDTGPKAEPVTVLLREAPMEDAKDGPPVIVHAACGLGRIVLVGFDLDTTPFSTWAGQKTMWDKLEAELDPRNANANREAQFLGNQGQNDEIGGELKRSLESFKEVPVISFGWVALFILVYIAIVGPLDYLILKKVFKRLEFTWITFPTVVVAISVAAYFTAYSLKGDDLRINKIDVYELDLHEATPQAYGTTWVTLFSPRIQNYTIGVEPTGPTAAQPTGPQWVGTPSTDVRASRPVVTVLDGDDTMIGRVGSQGLFRRAYEYAPDAAGLENVSIPVWSMRSFSARWRAPVPAGQVGIEADIHHTRDKSDSGLLGRITNHLPVELRDVTLLYKGRSYAADSVPPESFVAIDNLKVGEQGKPIPQWLADSGTLSARGDRTVTSPQLIRDLLFHSPPAQPAKSNGGWHQLDQAWRLRPLVEMSSGPLPQSVYRDEVVLVGRAPSRAAATEAVTRADAAPTRLWLESLPASGAERPSLSGFIVQDVYIRVYIPVNP